MKTGKLFIKLVLPVTIFAEFGGILTALQPISKVFFIVCVQKMSKNNAKSIYHDNFSLLGIGYAIFLELLILLTLIFHLQLNIRNYVIRILISGSQ